MLTDHETRFMGWWEKNRLREKKSMRQWLVGLPLGLVFGLPILLNFASGWYKRASMWARGHSDDNSMVVILIAVILIATFFSLFYKKHKWDMNEQLYKELAEKKKSAEKQLSGPQQSL
ncbi:MAG: hypothetical protein H7Y27_06245 [Gemmatimonadaceae bacterium]|nr:hypothetical protein [Chitinophagaceae bacterium]